MLELLSISLIFKSTLGKASSFVFEAQKYKIAQVVGYDS
jgi:hypothetical protein